ncbi:unnamed protein product [Adineta ricciae]|nr:unnamed protein product [Adineta ricciae]
MHATLPIRTSEHDYENLGVDQQKELLNQAFADARFEAPRLLQDLMDKNEYYFGAIEQVKMRGWSQGQAAVVGDAGYCFTLVTGIGTIIALVGSYILTGEIGRCQDYLEASKRYEMLMRPIVTKAQQILSIDLRIAGPDIIVAITLRNVILDLVIKLVVTRSVSKLLERKAAADTTILPGYDFLLSQKDQ